MALRQVERLRLSSERNGNIFSESPKLPLRRFSLLFRDVFKIRFAHTKWTLVSMRVSQEQWRGNQKRSPAHSIQREESRLLVAMDKMAIAAQITFTKEEG